MSVLVPSVTVYYVPEQYIQTNQIVAGLISSVLEILFAILIIVGLIGSIIEGAKEIWRAIHE